jgi:hypothetical protein
VWSIATIFGNFRRVSGSDVRDRLRRNHCGPRGSNERTISFAKAAGSCA